ncbi:MAG: CBS domain-containing protein [Deltaproteobacteria bacterium]|nr:CBS domain-containing protein [Deltaproteobacteria bacterium]
MRDEGFFFVRVAEVCRRAVVTCTPTEDLLTVAARMREKNISGLVVCCGAKPMGIITDRDFRNQLDRIAETSGRILAGDVMSAPLTTIREEEHVFEAIYRMAKNRIHRLVVVDDVGRLAGILTDTDVLKLQMQTPLYFGRDIEGAGSIEELRELNARAIDVVFYACRAGARTADVIRLIAHFHDAMAQRAIELLLHEIEGVPEGFAFLALGSEGRREQTLKTDQDNAIVFDDAVDSAGLVALQGFSEKLIEAMIRIGVPPCPGRTMANNPQWRRSLTDWSRLLTQWISTPSPENMVNFGMICDLRTVYGSHEYEKQLKELIRREVHRNSLFLAYFGRNILRFRPPLGFFGRIKTERSGDHKGTIDLKKAGIFALQEGVTLFSMRAGILDGSTAEKLRALRGQGAMPARDLERIELAFDFLSYLRLRHQARQVRDGQKPDNYINPTDLSLSEGRRLKETLESVEFFQKFIENEFQLSSIPH